VYAVCVRRARAVAPIHIYNPQWPLVVVVCACPYSMPQRMDETPSSHKQGHAAYAYNLYARERETSDERPVVPLRWMPHRPPPLSRHAVLRPPGACFLPATMSGTHATYALTCNLHAFARLASASLIVEAARPRRDILPSRYTSYTPLDAQHAKVLNPLPLLRGIVGVVQRIPLPVRHRHEMPAQVLQLPALEQRGASGSAPHKV